MTHALITGPITGRIPTPDPAIPHDFVDVTPDVLYFDDQAHALAIADAIEDEHWARGSHPVQLAVKDHAGRDDVSDEERAQAKSQHDEVSKRVAKRTAKHGKG